MVVKTDLAESSTSTLDVSSVKKKSKKGKEVGTGDAEAGKKKRRKEATEEKPEEGDKELTDTNHKTPKQHRKHPDDSANVETDTAAEDAKKHKKKRKHRELAASEPSAEDTEQDVKKHKKRRKHSDDEGNTAELDETPDGKESSKKHRRSKRDDKPLGTAEELESGSKKKKKRRKHSDHGFKDPSTDESLSEQAGKALSYAFAQVDSPASWKFNKARQNWLIRNILSEEAIPDAYVPLVTRYMSGVQGGAREALIKSCRDAIAGQSGTEGAELSTQAASSEEKPAATPTVTFQPTAKEQRARNLLQLLTETPTH